MDKVHKDLLIVQRANLVDNLNMRSGLFTQLLCRKIIDQRMVRKIKNGNTEDEQAEELLDYLPKSDQGAKTFDLFCEALIADSQGNIVKSFLRPEGEEESRDENKEVTPQGSSESSTGIREDVALQGRGHVCTESSTDLQCSQDGDRIPASPNVMATVAIREELQQNLYRRTIEPRNLHLSHSSESFPSNTENEARFLYQNSLRNPSVLTNLQRKVDPFVAKDGDASHHQTVTSSVEFPEKTFAQLPNVFSVSPNKEINISTSNSGARSNLHTLNFVDGNTQNVYSQSVLNSISSKPCLRHSFSDYNLAQRSLEGKGQENPLIDYTFEERSPPMHYAVSNPVLKELYPSPSKHTNTESSAWPGSPLKHQMEHNFKEIQRYIEVNSTEDGNVHRKMVSFPHQITTLPASAHPELANEEHLRGENRGSPRLLRNDSVDTMHKRPLTESQGNKRQLKDDLKIDYKRFREYVDTCNLQEVRKPEKLTTLNVFDKMDQQVIKIPTIDAPLRKHSLPSVVIDTDQHLEKRSSLLGAMDDPEIDLTDGPISVNVELSTRQFYLTHYKQAYAMRRIPRGKALIMNVNEVVGKSARRGTDIDRDNLHNLLCQMHFDVTVYNDSDGLTAMEMVEKLQAFSQQPDHANADCTVVCILSHGEEGYIFGADGKKFELDAVFSLFDNTCCPNLRGKPKIFIIQACRGGALDRGVQYYPDEHDGADARVRQVPSMSDMLICYPTQNGYYAWRNRDRGSWYVEALVQIFMKYAKSEDICTMLNRVNLLVSKKVSHCPNIDMDQMSQMSEYKSTLRMPHLYFFPGIGGCS